MNKGQFREQPAMPRFMAKVAQRPNGCWEWTAWRMRHKAQGITYGRFQIDGRLQLAHRAAWQLFRGPIPEGMNVLHRCDNRACVNPDHLFLGTQRDNVRDMNAKGRRRDRPHIGEAHPNAKLTEVDVRAIRASTERVGVLARKYGVNHSVISDIRRRRAWVQIL